MSPDWRSDDSFLVRLGWALLHRSLSTLLQCFTCLLTEVSGRLWLLAQAAALHMRLPGVVLRRCKRGASIPAATSGLQPP